MTTFDYSTVPNNILVSWMRSMLTGTQDDVEGFLVVIKMSESDRATSLQTYINARVSANSAASSFLTTAEAAAQSSLSSDTTTCNSLLSALNTALSLS